PDPDKIAESVRDGTSHKLDAARLPLKRGAQVAWANVLGAWEAFPEPAWVYTPEHNRTLYTGEAVDTAHEAIDPLRAVPLRELDIKNHAAALRLLEIQTGEPVTSLTPGKIAGLRRYEFLAEIDVTAAFRASSDGQATYQAYLSLLDRHSAAPTPFKESDSSLERARLNALTNLKLDLKTLPAKDREYAELVLSHAGHSIGGPVDMETWRLAQNNFRRTLIGSCRTLERAVKQHEKSLAVDAAVAQAVRNYVANPSITRQVFAALNRAVNA
ncbi:MAG: hypothetical protein AAF658_08910, partial [Myxococcota bacterium]